MSYTYEEKMEKLLEEQKKYRDNLVLCKDAYDELKRKLQLIENTHKGEGFRTIYKTDRIKSENSYLGKVSKRLDEGKEFSFEEAHDIVGFRYICLNEDDAIAFVNYIKNYVNNSKSINFVEEKDYIHKPKESGYRSYHIIVEVPVETMIGVTNIKAEIQVRTILMDVFAREEHKLNYKGDCSEESKDLLLDLNADLRKKEEEFKKIVCQEDLVKYKNRLKQEQSEESSEMDDEYEKISYLYYSARSILMGKLNSLLSEYPDSDDIVYKQDRIKPVNSIRRKLFKKGLNFTAENIKTKVGDVVGFKIVCSNEKEVRKLVDYFKSSEALEIRCEKDYLTKRKNTGYRGYHFKVVEEIPGKNGKVPIVSEIQLRTMLMDAWASFDDIVYGEEKSDDKKRALADLSSSLRLLSLALESIKEIEAKKEKEEKINYVKELEEYKNNKKNVNKLVLTNNPKTED